MHALLAKWWSYRHYCVFLYCMVFQWLCCDIHYIAWGDLAVVISHIGMYCVYTLFIVPVFFQPCDYMHSTSSMPHVVDSWRCRIGRIHLLEGWNISAYAWNISHMPTTLRVCGCIMKVIWIARSDTKPLSSYWFGLSTWFWLEVFMYLSSLLGILTTYSNPVMPTVAVWVQL